MDNILLHREKDTDSYSNHSSVQSQAPAQRILDVMPSSNIGITRHAKQDQMRSALAVSELKQAAAATEEDGEVAAIMIIYYPLSLS